MNASRLVSLFLCLSLALPCAAFADTAPASGQKTDAPASTPKPVPDPTQDVWTTLLQNRVEELGAIDAETVALTKRLPDASRKLNAALSGIEEEYQRLMTLSRVSRGLPLELSVVQQRLARLNDKLSDVLEPLEGTLNTLKSRLSEISLLEQDSAPSKDETDISPELQAFLSDLAQTQGRLNADYASQLAAKVQELRQQQRQEYNQNYLTAVSGSMGQQTTGTQTSTGTTDTTGETNTNASSHSTSVTTTGGGGGRKKATASDIDVIAY